MENDVTSRIIPNEVILVGVLKPNAVKISLTTADGKEKSTDELKKEVLEAYQFSKVSNPSEVAKKAGVKPDYYFQIQMGDPGGEWIILPNNVKVKRSRKTTRPGFDNIFERSRATTFAEIKEEVKAAKAGALEKIELVGGDPNSGKIRLTQYALMGFWDEFGLGFWYTPHFYDPLQNGKLVPLMSTVRKDDGSYAKEPAKSNTGRMFVYEDEVHNLDALREGKRTQAAQYEIKIVDNTKLAGQLVDESAKANETTDNDVV